MPRWSSFYRKQSATRLRATRLWCVAVFASIDGKTPHEQCFPEDGVCFVTYGKTMDQPAARQFCAELSNRSSLPTISNQTRLLHFNEFLGDASSVTNNQSVWLDIHKSKIRGLSRSLIVTNRILN